MNTNKMLSMLNRLTKPGDGKKGNTPSPMSSSLQKKFSKGVDYNMKILIKGDRNVGKSCLLQRLQGGPFIEEYQSSDQIQIAPIHWKYKETDHIIKVEVWEVVDKGRAKKKGPGSLKFENSSLPPAVDAMEIPPLDASFLDVYANANGVIMMMDITKAWTFEYIKREITTVPSDIPIIILGNHCDMHHHREVSPYQIEMLVNSTRQCRPAAVRYAETSMRNGFGLRLLHKFLNIPFLQLQRSTLLNQLSVNNQEMNEASEELDEFEKSESADYDLFIEKLSTRRQQENCNLSNTPKIASEKSPSIVLGGGKPIIPPNVNPLAQSKIQKSLFPITSKIAKVNVDSNNFIPIENNGKSDANGSTKGSEPTHDKPNTIVYMPTPQKNKDDIDDFCPGVLDHSFLDDLSPTNRNFPDGVSNSNYGGSAAQNIDSDSGEESINPLVVGVQDDLDSEDEANQVLKIENSVGKVQIGSNKHDNPITRNISDNITPVKCDKPIEYDKNKNLQLNSSTQKSTDSNPEVSVPNFKSETGFNIYKQPDSYSPYSHNIEYDSGYELNQQITYDSSPTWPLDTSVRRSPEGGEGDSVSFNTETKKESKSKEEKKHKKSKKSSKDKDRDRERSSKEKDSEKSKEKKHKDKKHRKKGSNECLEEFLNGSGSTPDAAQEAYEAL